MDRGSLLNINNGSSLFVTASDDGLQTLAGSLDAGQLWTWTATQSASRNQAVDPIAFGGSPPSRALHHRQTGANGQHYIDILGYYEAA